MQSVPAPEFKDKTNGDLLYHGLELRKALALANSDKAALRDWRRSSDCLGPPRNDGKTL
jgi:hypothetical protein